MVATSVTSKFYNLDRDENLTANSDYYIPSQKAVKAALSKKQNVLTAGNGIKIENDIINATLDANSLKFNDVIVETSTFTLDNVYSDFPYKADITLDDVTEEMFPIVIFNAQDAMSGIYSFMVESFNGGVRIWSKYIPDSTLIIPTIVCQ